MSVKFSFTCKKCGNCCENLVRDTPENVSSGLALFPEEVNLFIENLVVPYRGKGIFPEDERLRIVLYQLDSDVCPHLIKKGNSAICKIHETRPLTCRVFPFSPIGEDTYGKLIMQTDPECKSVQEFKYEYPHMHEFLIHAPTEEKAAGILWYKMRFPRGPNWVYDLNSKDWIFSAI